MIRRRRPWWRGHPAAFVVAYTFGLIGTIALTATVAADFGVDPSWPLAAMAIVVALGAVALLQTTGTRGSDGWRRATTS